MRIAYITRSDFGAMGEAAILNYVNIVSKKHKVLVVEHPRGESIVSPKPKGVQFVSPPKGRLDDQLLFLYKTLSEFKPDIVHLIQSPHCFDYILHIQHLIPNSRWIIDFRSPHVGPLDSPILKKFSSLQFLVHAIFTHSMPSLKTNIKWRFKRAYHVPPGVNISSIKQSERNNFLPKKFIYIGSLAKTRKVDLLIEWFAHFRKNSTIEAELHVYGTGNTADELKKVVKDKSLDGFIKFYGSLPQMELWKLIANYDAGLAYVPLESFSSAPSLKSIEYIAAKLPVFTSKTPGHIDFSKQYNVKFHYFENNKDSFNNEISAFCSKPVNEKELTANHKNIQCLDWEYIVENKVEKIYNKLSPK